LRCPHCKYVWCKRAEKPVSCPRCKKRFDYPSNRKTLEEEDLLTDDIREFLKDANRMSLESESLDETMEKAGNL
jgi:hypothetical protein